MTTEYYGMTHRNRIRTSFIILLSLVLVCVLPVCAADYTGTLNPVLPANQIIDPIRAGSVTFTYDTASTYSIHWMTDFDTIGIPDTLIMYFQRDFFAIGTTTFELRDATGIYATGTINFLNGTAMYGSSKQYMYLQFSSWTPGARVGAIQGNLSIPASHTITRTDPTGTNVFGQTIIAWDVLESSPMSVPIGGSTAGGVLITGVGGTIYTPYPYTTLYSYSVDKIGGSGFTQLSTVTFTKPANNLATNARAYNATTGDLLWQSSFTDTSTGEAPIITGSNYFLSMYVPLNGFIYNSSSFYPSTAPVTPTPTSTPSGYTVLNLDVRDLVSHSTIPGAHVGIYNASSGVWRNTTTPTGLVYYDSTDSTPEIPLKVGQTVTLNAWAYGYKNTSDNYATVTIPYSGYTSTIILTPDTVVNATGTFWLTVRLTDNANGLPIGNGYVRLITGGVESLQGTDSTGYTVFENKTASTTFSVEAFAQVYDSQTKVLPVTGDYMSTSFSLVRKGAIPYTTPMTPVTTRTTAPVVTWTNTGGQPLSEQEGSALDAFNQISRSLESWFNIGAGIITIWLLWILVYELTGGKVIDKLMRRGRR